MALIGGYSAKNGAREAPIHKLASNGSTLGEDFPMLCETCLGPNPYVRMMKLPFGHKLCKISNIPFQAFKWKAGPGGRYKETMVCYPVAAERNMCQSCLNDMKYGLPVGVRDALMAQQSNSNQVALPQSDVGQRYYYEQQALAVQTKQANSSDLLTSEISNIASSKQLDKFSRILQVAEAKSKVAFRNLPKLCTFWLVGKCTRVERKTCPFRPCCGVFAFPEIAGSDKEKCESLIERLNAEGPAIVQKSLDEETRYAFQQALKGNREENIRKRVTGKDDLTQKYLGKMKKMDLQLTPPEDPSVITLWLGNIEPDISEDDIRSTIYAYGQIASIVLVRSAKCAFVEYVDRGEAEAAAAHMYNALMIQGRPINVNWAKPKQSSGLNGPTTGEDSNISQGGQVFLPPPGMENAPVSAYSLAGMPIPPLRVPFGDPGAVKRPPPPPSAPPGKKRQKTDTGVVTGGSSGESYFGDYGDDDEDEGHVGKEGFKPVPPPSAPPADVKGSVGKGKHHKKVLKPENLYPSMNPSRMGSQL